MNRIDGNHECICVMKATLRGSSEKISNFLMIFVSTSKNYGKHTCFRLAVSVRIEWRKIYFSRQNSDAFNPTLNTYFTDIHDLEVQHLLANILKWRTSPCVYLSWFDGTSFISHRIALASLVVISKARWKIYFKDSAVSYYFLNWVWCVMWDTRTLFSLFVLGRCKIQPQTDERGWKLSQHLSYRAWTNCVK